MATIRKRGDSWEVQIRLKGHEHVSASFCKKVLADDWATTKEAEIKEGRSVNTKAAAKTLLVDLCDKYIEHIIPTHEPSSHVTDRSRIGHIKRFCSPRQITLAGLNIDHIIEYVDERLLKVGPDAIRRELCVWSDLVESSRSLWGLHIVSNPVENAKRVLRKLRKLKPGNRRTRRLKPGEYEKIRDCPHSHFTLINQISLFAIETAMRQAEIAKARYEYVDFSKRIIHVPKSKMDWLTGKRGKVVPLSPTAIKILEELPVRFIDGTIFGITGCAIKKAFRRLCRQLGLKDLRFHDLCHEATSRLFEQGFGIEEVSTITGKKDWRTLARYTHPDPEKLALRMR